MYILNLIITTLALISVAVSLKCSSSSRKVPKYHLLEKCHRSKLGTAAKAKYKSLISCQKLGIEKRALAVNFSPPEAELYRNETSMYTCEVLKCAEFYGGLSLANDKRYDYYSIYAKPTPHVNSTCIPTVGMFYLLSQRLNFSQAADECKNMSGVLSDMASEHRTEALAQLLTGAGVDKAYVGMRSINGSDFVGVNGDTLDCTSYRAWAPGHPRRIRKKFDCIVITRQKIWQSTSCKTRYPALCELLPGGPYKRGSIFATNNYQSTTTTNNGNKM